MYNTFDLDSFFQSILLSHNAGWDCKRWKYVCAKKKKCLTSMLFSYLVSCFANLNVWSGQNSIIYKIRFWWYFFIKRLNFGFSPCQRGSVAVLLQTLKSHVIMWSSICRLRVLSDIYDLKKKTQSKRKSKGTINKYTYRCIQIQANNIKFNSGWRQQIFLFGICLYYGSCVHIKTL